jgi:hypothetical protein
MELRITNWDYCGWRNYPVSERINLSAFHGNTGFLETGITLGLKISDQ